MTRTRYSLALAALLAAACPAAAEIVIGVAGPFSGSSAALGEQLRRGVDAAVSDLNATGGIRGERVSVQYADDGCDPRKAVEVATGFVSDGIRMVIGHYCSGASIPAAKVYEKAGAVMISPASTHPKLTDEGGWNVIRLVPRDDAQAAAAARLVLDKFPGRKIAIASDEQPGFATLAGRFRATLAENGIAPVADEILKAGSKDVAPLAEKLKAAGAEVVYLAASYVESGLLARALRATGSTAQFVSGDALVTDDFLDQARDASAGTLMTFNHDPRRFPTARAVVERLRAQEKNPEGFTLYAYAAAEALAAAAEATASTDATRIAEWLRGGNRFDTIVGAISFDAKGDLRNPMTAWFRWVDGRYVEIDPATLQPPVPDTTP